MSPDGERRARVALSFLAKPGDPVLGEALRTRTAAEVLVTGTDADGDALLADQAEDGALSRAILRWRDRPGEVPSTARLAGWQDAGLRLVMPGDAEWPTQLDDLGGTRPLLLWLRGTANLRLTCVNSVAIVGSRAATGYGQHVAIELAAALAEKTSASSAAAPRLRNPKCAHHLYWDVAGPVIPTTGWSGSRLLTQELSTACLRIMRG